MSAGLRANARSEGHGQLFLVSGFAVTDASAENIDAQGGAAFHLTTHGGMAGIGEQFWWREQKPTITFCAKNKSPRHLKIHTNFLRSKCTVVGSQKLCFVSVLLVFCVFYLNSLTMAATGVILRRQSTDGGIQWLRV